jgi:hypothetical protein
VTYLHRLPCEIAIDYGELIACMNLWSYVEKDDAEATRIRSEEMAKSSSNGHSPISPFEGKF